MILIPPIEIQQGLAFTHDFVWEEDGIPVDMTGWTGEFVAKADYGDDNKLVTATPVLGSSGEITITLTADQTASLPARDRQGPVKIGVYQIKVSGGSTGQIFQGDLHVSAAL